MQFMIVEHFKPGKTREIYTRAGNRGRMIPDGLHFVNSWVSETLTTCYQVMETNDINLLHEWISHWNDLVDFEIIPVISSSAARQIALGPTEQ